MNLEKYVSHPELLIFINTFIAIVLSGIIGYEREVKDKPAGFRTNMIVGGVSALLVGVSQILITSFSAKMGDTIEADPIRVIQAIIIGISFLGAGTILKTSDDKETHEVRYLTTSATLLFSAAVGICVGLNLYLLSVGVTLLVWIINYILKYFKKYI